MYALINRNKVCVDVQNEEPRYVKLQIEPTMVIGCSKAEGTGVIASDCDTIYMLAAADYTSNVNAVSVVEIDSVPMSYSPNEFVYDDSIKSLVERYSLEEKKLLKQEENKAKFSNYLNGQTLTWVDGKQYGISEADQGEISLNLNQYALAVSAGVESPVLEWHARHEECQPWTAENLTALSLAIANAVYPLYHLMQGYKTAIFGANSYEELAAIKLQYGDEEEEVITDEEIIEEDN